jgi:hypothetical protein
MIIGAYRKKGFAHMVGSGPYVAWWVVGGKSFFRFALTCSSLCYRKYAIGYSSMTLLETAMDLQASTVKSLAWLRGLRSHGLIGAHQAAAGLS